MDAEVENVIRTDPCSMASGSMEEDRLSGIAIPSVHRLTEVDLDKVMDMVMMLDCS